MKTKHLRPLALCVISSFGLAQADIIEFDLSPVDTDVAEGLSPLNEVPPNASTGTGGEVSGGISFDTTTNTLTIAIGYGSSAGFTDLTGAGTDFHIHGPAAAGASAGPLLDLEPMLFEAADPAKGGLIFGSIVYTAPQAADLLAGLHYVNIHTVANSAGEIRGQLIRANTSPEITFPSGGVVGVECGLPTTYTAVVADSDGDAMQVVWTLDGVPVRTQNIPASDSASSTELSHTATLHERGFNSLSVTATDSAGNVTTATIQILVDDTIAPVIDSLTVNPKVLWPPNHKMVPVRVNAIVSDNCEGATWEVISVTSNQAVNEPGSGNTSPDWSITSNHAVSLRAERSGKGKEGRIYTIKVRAKDEAGNVSAVETVTVKVPHDKGKKN